MEKRVLFYFSQNDIGGHTKFVLNLSKIMIANGFSCEAYVPWFTHFYYTKNIRKNTGRFKILFWSRYVVGQIKDELFKRKFEWRGSNLKIVDLNVKRYMFKPSINYLKSFDVIVTSAHWQPQELIDAGVDLEDLVHVIHHPHTDNSNHLEHYFKNPSFRVVASSERTANQLVLLGIKKPRIINLGVDSQIFHQSQKHLNDGKFNFGLFFYNHPRKNPELVISIVQHIKNNYEMANIYIFGNGFPKITGVTVFENLSESEYATKLCQLDLFIYASKFEGFGLPPLEAMACGVPVISSKVGATMDYITSNQNGILLEPNSDLIEWTIEIDKIVNNQSFRLMLASAGQNTAREWSWDKTARLYLQFLFSAN